MNDKAKELINRKFDQSQYPINKVIDIVREYFGEDLVDANPVTTYELIKPSLNQSIREHVKIISKGTELFFTPRNDPNSTEYHIKDVSKFNSFTFEDVLTEDTIDAFAPRIKYLLQVTQYSQSNIVIRFPRVTVTNEHDRSVDITELYVKISVTRDGNLVDQLQLLRTEFPITHIKADYAHSHLPGIHLDWERPCFGSGPIVDTMSRLNRGYNEHIWGLFCLETDKYVRVESLEGVPYRRLESIGVYERLGEKIHNTCTFYNHPSTPFRENWLVDFLKRFLSNSGAVKLAYVNGNYTLGESLTEFWLRVSKELIHYVNCELQSPIKVSFKSLLKDGVVKKYVFYNGNIYEPSNNAVDIDKYRIAAGTQLLMFKGKPVRLNIIEDDVNVTNCEVTLLSEYYIKRLICQILEVFNFRYSNEKREQLADENGGQDENSSSSISKKCFYF